MPTARRNNRNTRSHPTDVIRFDLFLDSDDSRIPQLAEDIYSEFAEAETRTHSRRDVDQVDKVKRIIRLLIVNLIKARNCGKQGVHLSLGRSNYTSNYVYNNNFTHARQFFSIINTLEAMDYINVERTQYRRATNNQPQSCIRLTDYLKDIIREALDASQVISFTRLEGEPLLILKNSQRKLKNYSWTPERIELQRNLETINQRLSSTYLDVCITDAEHASIETHIRERNQENRQLQVQEQEGWDDVQSDEFAPEWLDLKHKTLFRVFNVGSFERGGRFYGGWWMSIPKECRPYITIDGQPTVELDYKSMHVSLLYSLVGEEKPDGDGYMPDRYQHLTGAEWKAVRDLFKSLMTRAIGGTFDVASTDPAIVNGLNQLQLTYPQAMRLLRQKHSAIVHLLFQGKARELQYLDSVVAEQVMLRMIDQGVTVLPIHDSFIAPASKLEELKQTLKTAYADTIRRRAPFKSITGLDTNQTVVGDSRLNDVQQNPQSYTKYLNRYNSIYRQG